MNTDRYAPLVKELTPCVEMQIAFPIGKSHHTDCPFALHRQYTLSWDYYSRGELFFIQSQKCTRALCAIGQLCRPCTDLLSDGVLKGILQRIKSGIPENTPFTFMPISILMDLLRSKSHQCRSLKLTRLNDLRALSSKMGQLDEHKQFVIAIASGKVASVPKHRYPFHFHK
ncbi:hypothetical protein B0H10DRAFT_1821788 [Mycena sp. CBHHK59/15]|nr:hypothetical protein B0H10DRAFT_1821788 [Mycena sp. CBHHK59/15]